MKRAAVTFRSPSKAQPYLDALRDAGIEPVPATPDHPAASLAGLDALVLAGGTDLDPSLYGQPRQPETENPDVERDALEQLLLGQALARDLPILAICRGMQLFNVSHPGGTLVQHMQGHRVKGPDRSEPVHEVIVSPGTLLEKILGAGRHPVNSRHHQAVDRVGAGLVVSARAPDGIVEALERADRKFALAVQWHPEDQTHRFPEQSKLFAAFAAAF